MRLSDVHADGRHACVKCQQALTQCLSNGLLQHTGWTRDHTLNQSARTCVCVCVPVVWVVVAVVAAAEVMDNGGGGGGAASQGKSSESHVPCLLLTSLQRRVRALKHSTTSTSTSRQRVCPRPPPSLTDTQQHSRSCLPACQSAPLLPGWRWSVWRPPGTSGPARFPAAVSPVGQNGAPKAGRQRSRGVWCQRTQSDSSSSSRRTQF